MNIKDMIAELSLSDFYIVRQSVDVTKMPVLISPKVSLGRRNGSVIKKVYVDLYKELQDSEDGVRPTVAIHHFAGSKYSENGIRIQSTTGTYWLLKPEEDYDLIYPEQGAVSDYELEAVGDYVPELGYEVYWIPENQAWDIMGRNSAGMQVFVGKASFIRAVDCHPILTKGVHVVDTSWKCDVLTISDEEILINQDQSIEISSGMYEGNKVVNSAQTIFTAVGEVYAVGTLQSKHV